MRADSGVGIPFLINTRKRKNLSKDNILAKDPEAYLGTMHLLFVEYAESEKETLNTFLDGHYPRFKGIGNESLNR